MMQSSLISSLFRKEVQALSAYKVADAKGLIKLDAMENPYSWPEELKNQWVEELKDCELNRYPDPEARLLADTLRIHDAIPECCDILLGNGSDEIIQMLLMALTPGAAVLSTTPSFVMYRQISLSLGLYFHGIALQDDFGLDVPAMLAAIAQHQPAVIFLAYPNNPTGNLFEAEAVHRIIKASSGLVIIDEAYAPFADASFMAQLANYDNLLVMRTLSKMGLAGLRLGYLMGHPDLIQQLNKIRLPYNINILSQVSAKFALTHPTVFDTQSQMICKHRRHVFEQLSGIPEITAYPSSANFILFRTPLDQADSIFSAIKQQGVLIKNLSAQGGLLRDCLRVTVGTETENEAFINALQNSLR
ncbi:MAG: histidinol-phosphate transaminase [Methylovulum sp.]|jgi:histidinol-phosphate aminotransferase|nr:histidinol-phosphate transaminase [Methylovulum sp.]MCF7998970.1 histidinol-phosphate transaminase [Methylovulum sp.]